MPYPDPTGWLYSWKKPLDEPTRIHASRVLQSYMGQLYLRKHLNTIHGMVYSANAANASLPTILNAVGDTRQRVESMEWVPQDFHFRETDPPAGDILSARLRAKYWGAQVITHRPCVKVILDLSYRLRAAEAKADGNRPIARTMEEVSQATINEMGRLQSIVWDYAQKGIHALIESTQAFHGLGEKRPIITNVFGTAHA
jgi:hypothetical protein